VSHRQNVYLLSAVTPHAAGRRQCTVGETGQPKSEATRQREVRRASARRADGRSTGAPERLFRRYRCLRNQELQGSDHSVCWVPGTARWT
jgi:hypothetical protein